MVRLFKRPRLLWALLLTSALIGVVCAKLNTSGNLTVAAAETHVFVDDPGVSIVDRRAVTDDVANLQKRAVLYGRVMTSPAVLAAIAKRAGVPAEQISGIARVTEGEPHSLLQIGSEERANQIRDSSAPYRLELQSSPAEPILAIYSEAPSLDTAPAPRGLGRPRLAGLPEAVGPTGGIPPAQRARVAPARQRAGRRDQQRRADHDRRSDVHYGVRAELRRPVRPHPPPVATARRRRASVARTTAHASPGRRGGLAADDAASPVVGGRTHGHDLVDPLRPDPASDERAGQHHPRSDGAANRRRYLADRAHRRRGGQATSADHARPRCSGRVHRLRVAKRGARCALSQPHERSHAVDQEAPASDLLSIDLRHRCELGAAHRGSGVHDVHGDSRGDLRYRGHLRVPLQAESVHQLDADACSRARSSLLATPR